MVRYLLHSKSGTYDATTGVTTHVLTERLPNPTRMTVRRVVYNNATQDPAPLVVYCRSVALTALLRDRHMVEIPETRQSSVVAVLPKGMQQHCYSTDRAESHAIHGHTHLRSIDISFSEHDTTLTPAIDGFAGGNFTAVQDNFSTPTGQEKTGKIFRAFDTGGPSGDYGVNETLNRIYISETGVNWKFEVLAFESESGFDKLSIMEVDSEDVETTLLDEHSGTSLPSPAVYTATQSKLKFYWNSDSSNQDLGFDIVLWEDDSGTNTLQEVDDVYTLVIPGSGSGSSSAHYLVELEIDTN